MEYQKLNKKLEKKLNKVYKWALKKGYTIEIDYKIIKDRNGVEFEY